MGRHTLGVMLLLGFLVATALRDTTVSGVFAHVSFFTYAFIAFGTTSVLFLIIWFIRAPKEIGLLASVPAWAVLVNCTTAVAWLSYFGALKMLEPSLVNAIFSGIAPLTVTLLAAAGLRADGDRGASTIEHGLHLGLVASLVILVGITLTGHGASGIVETSRAVTGVALATASGVFITMETVIAKRLNNVGISAGGVVATRFWLVSLIAMATLLFEGHGFEDQTFRSTGYLAGMTLVLIALPIYAAQSGLALTSPMTTNVIISLSPICVLTAQSIVLHLRPTEFSLIGFGIYGVFAIAAGLMRRDKKDLHKPCSTGEGTHLN